MKKRIISLMLAGITTLTLASCSDTNLQDSFYDGVTDKFIVIEQNDTDVLHKGSMGVMSGRTGKTSTTDYNYEFDCGEKTISNSEHQIFDNEPIAERYDVKCEGCFGVN